MVIFHHSDPNCIHNNCSVLVAITDIPLTLRKPSFYIGPTYFMNEDYPHNIYINVIGTQYLY